MSFAACRCLGGQAQVSEPVAQTGTVVRQPRPHQCDPGWISYEIDDADIPELNGQIGVREDPSVRPGDIWECECGKTRVAYQPQYSNLIYFGVKYRPEGRIARWRRERDARKLEGDTVSDLEPGPAPAPPVPNRPDPGLPERVTRRERRERRERKQGR